MNIVKEKASENLPIQHKPERFVVCGTTLIKSSNITYQWGVTAPTKDSALEHTFDDVQTKVTITKITDLGTDSKKWKTFKVDVLDTNEVVVVEQEETQNEFF